LRNQTIKIHYSLFDNRQANGNWMCFNKVQFSTAKMQIYKKYKNDWNAPKILKNYSNAINSLKMQKMQSKNC